MPPAKIFPSPGGPPPPPPGGGTGGALASAGRLAAGVGASPATWPATDGAERSDVCTSVV